MQRYVVNASFDENVLGEYIEADPAMVSDWLDAGYISEVDERGERIVGIPLGSESAPREVRGTPGVRPDDAHPGTAVGTFTTNADDDTTADPAE